MANRSYYQDLIYLFSFSTLLKLKFVDVLKELQNPEGGFYGFVKGSSHLISTYAGVMSVANLAIPEAYDLIDRKKLKEYLLKMKNNDIEFKQKNTFLDKNNNFLIYSVRCAIGEEVCKSRFI